MRIFVTKDELRKEKEEIDHKIADSDRVHTKLI